MRAVKYYRSPIWLPGLRFKVCRFASRAIGRQTIEQDISARFWSQTELMKEFQNSLKVYSMSFTTPLEKM